MPAVTDVGQYQQEELDALEQWAHEAGIGMDELADKILRLAERRIRSRRSAHYAGEASGANVVPLCPVG